MTIAISKLVFLGSTGSPPPRGRTAERAIDFFHVRLRGNGDPGPRTLKLTKHEVLRGLAAGAAFCVILTTGFAAMSAGQCGGVCLPEVAGNAVLSLAAGIFGLGPVAAYGGRR